MCCGYPDHLDDSKYKKADPSSYHQLSKSIDEAAFNQISIEDKHCCNDLNLLQQFENKTVIFGSLAIASSRLETVEEVVERLRAALGYIDRDRLVVAPDCGLGLLPAKLAEDKLRVMCRAAALVLKKRNTAVRAVKINFQSSQKISNGRNGTLIVELKHKAWRDLC